MDWHWIKISKIRPKFSFWIPYTHWNYFYNLTLVIEKNSYFFFYYKLISIILKVFVAFPLWSMVFLMEIKSADGKKLKWRLAKAANERKQ